MKETYDLFEHQPEGCREGLPVNPEKIKHLPEYIQRILLLNPAYIYENLRYKLNPFNRYNWQNIQFAEMFPPVSEGLCPCGCGQEAKGSGYASTDCQFFMIGVWNIIGYRQEFLAEIFNQYRGGNLCFNCNTRPIKEWDHICPVSEGGGGSWLPNHQGLCKKCHTEKTRSDFGWTKLKTSTEYE